MDDRHNTDKGELDRSRHLMMTRHESSWRKGAIRRVGGCRRVVGFSANLDLDIPEEQKSRLVWLHGVCNMLFFSELGSKLMRALYVDWVLGISRNHARRSPATEYLRYMTDLANAHPGTSTPQYVDIPRFLSSLREYSPKDFGGEQTSDRIFLKNLYAVAGIPKERIRCIKVKNVDEWKDVHARVAKKIRRSKSAPVVVIIHLGEGTNFQVPTIFGSMREDRRTDYEYELDAGLFKSLEDDRMERHTVAGFVCNLRNRLVLDGGRPGRASSANVNHDWIKEGQFEVSGFTFDAHMSSRILVYYNKSLVSAIHVAARAISREWFRNFSSPAPRFVDDIPLETRMRWKHKLHRVY